MSPILKFIGGVIGGAALGAGIYVVLTRDNGNGIIDDAKQFLNNAAEQGKQAAEARRTELQTELGQQRLESL